MQILRTLRYRRPRPFGEATARLLRHLGPGAPHRVALVARESWARENQPQASGGGSLGQQEQAEAHDNPHDPVAPCFFLRPTSVGRTRLRETESRQEQSSRGRPQRTTPSRTSASPAREGAKSRPRGTAEYQVVVSEHIAKKSDGNTASCGRERVATPAELVRETSAVAQAAFFRKAHQLE